MITTDTIEAAFREWQLNNYEVLMFYYPATVGMHGAANNFDYWSRKVFKGNITDITPQEKAELLAKLG